MVLLRCGPPIQHAVPRCEARGASVNTQFGLLRAGTAVWVIGLVCALVGTRVALQDRAFLAEARPETTQLESWLLMRIKQTHVRSAKCQLAEEGADETGRGLPRDWGAAGPGGRLNADRRQATAGGPSRMRRAAGPGQEAYLR
jgi:hypothetical protein